MYDNEDFNEDMSVGLSDEDAYNRKQ